MSKGNYDAFLAALRKKESRDTYHALNDKGCAGAYQMGKPALIDAGFVVHPNPGHHVTDNDWTTARWTDKAKNMGVNSLADFLGAKADENGLPKYEEYSTAAADAKGKKSVPSKGKKMRIALDPSKAETAKKAQDEAAKAHNAQAWRIICRKELDSYVDTTIREVKLTASALLGAYHLAGTGFHTNRDRSRQPGLEAYLHSGGELDGEDDYGSTVSEYISLFNDYDVPYLKIHHQAPGQVGGQPRTNKKYINPKAGGRLHPHAAETTAWYQQDYYTTKHWNIASRLYHLYHRDDADNG